MNPAEKYAFKPALGYQNDANIVAISDETKTAPFDTNGIPYGPKASFDFDANVLKVGNAVIKAPHKIRSQNWKKNIPAHTHANRDAPQKIDSAKERIKLQGRITELFFCFQSEIHRTSTFWKSKFTIFQNLQMFNA